VTRRTIIELAREEGLAVESRRITRDEVYIADEAFFTGTAAEVVPILEVDRRRIGSGQTGSVTARLRQRFRDCVLGHDPRHLEWLTPAGND
jgi:branched-chain amino acid aminotransferase